jgi:serine/threonine protein kinase
VNWEHTRKEIAIMSMLRHDNVVRIIASFVDERELCIVMPLLDGGSCGHIMAHIAPTGFKDEAVLATILRETLQGLEYFHKDGRVHRDVKAGNILISAQGEVQVADFGVAGTLLEGCVQLGFLFCFSLSLHFLSFSSPPLSLSCASLSSSFIRPASTSSHWRRLIVFQLFLFLFVRPLLRLTGVQIVGTTISVRLYTWP